LVFLVGLYFNRFLLVYGFSWFLLLEGFSVAEFFVDWFYKILMSCLILGSWINNVNVWVWLFNFLTRSFQFCSIVIIIFNNHSFFPLTFIHFLFVCLKATWSLSWSSWPSSHDLHRRLGRGRRFHPLHFQLLSRVVLHRLQLKSWALKQSWLGLLTIISVGCLICVLVKRCF